MLFEPVRSAEPPTKNAFLLANLINENNLTYQKENKSITSKASDIKDFKIFNNKFMW